MEESMQLISVKIIAPPDTNLILGQTHFIKSTEDLYEALISSAPGIKFGLSFSEASGKRLVRTEGNDDELIKAAQENSIEIGCGHSTANSVEVIIAQTEQGRGILGVIDGESPRGVESSKDKEERRSFLRTIGYKR
jgi:uncharacterized protein